MKTKNPMNQLAGKQKIKNNIAKILNNLMLWTYKTTVIYPLGYSIYKLINKHQPSTTGRKP